MSFFSLLARFLKSLSVLFTELKKYKNLALTIAISPQAQWKLVKVGYYYFTIMQMISSNFKNVLYFHILRILKPLNQANNTSILDKLLHKTLNNKKNTCAVEMQLQKAQNTKKPIPIIVPKQKLYLSNTSNKFINTNAKKPINIPLLKQVLSRSFDNELVDPAFIDQVTREAIEIIKIEPNVLFLKQPIRILGDIHGQYMDLLKILSIVPALDQDPNQKLLFLGDYVDRGICGAEVVILLFAYKVMYPNQVFLLRGNHESRIMTQQLNFFEQFSSKYPQQLYFKITDAFDMLPLAAVVNDKYFCVHGGLSADLLRLGSLKELNKINRFQQIPLKGQMCDMLWADPVRQDHGECQQKKLYTLNDSRGCSVYFGRDLTQKFLKDHKLQTVIRAHQLIDTEGYKKHMWPGWNDSPSVITIFSAPNYCGTYTNKAVVLSVKNGKLQIRQFNQENPNIHLSPQYDAFNLSVPRLINFIDKFAKNLVKSYADKNFPQFKNYDLNKKMQLLIKGKYPNIELAKQVEVKYENPNWAADQRNFVLPQIKNLSSSASAQIFRRSKQYFAESQRVPKNTNYYSNTKAIQNAQRALPQIKQNQTAFKISNQSLNLKPNIKFLYDQSSKVTPPK